jgi:hypothetical protein
VLTFNCGANNNLGSILSDGGAGASASGSFLMQQGTYQVQFYAAVEGCGQVNLNIGNGTTAFFPTSGIVVCPGNTNNFGIMAGAVILAFGAGQVMQFTVTAPVGSLGFSGVGPNVIITKLQ